MELGPRQGMCAVATVVVLLLAGCCFEGAQGNYPLPQPDPKPGVFFPYLCPHDVTLTKLKINQSESGYVQYTQYDVQVPTLTSFTMHYWFNLADTTTTSTMFQYGKEPFDSNEDLTVQLEVLDNERNQYWSIFIDGLLYRVPVDTPIKKGEWHHALHSWDSETGDVTTFIDGNFLDGPKDYHWTRGLVIRGGGVPVSGQHQVTSLHEGMDQGQGLNGWFTLFQFSTKPIGISSSYASAVTKAKLAFQCSGDMEGDLISWTRTPRKGYGGVTEIPSDSKACGRF